LLKGNKAVAQDPPDRFFYWDEITIGAELFELDQLYATRALVESLTNEIYAEIERQKLGDRYLGNVVQLVSNLTVSASDDVRSKWQKSGITKRMVKVFAREFVDLLQTNFPSPKMLSDHVLSCRIDPRDYPALSAFGNFLVVGSTQINDIRRSDGKASPLVILGGATLIDENELEESIVRKITDKIDGRTKWKKVDHAVLIAHDLPRGHIYNGFWQPWEKLLKRASRHLNILKAFDEFWLITYRKLSTVEGTRIVGSEPKK